jgi:hypothetical protein
MTASTRSTQKHSASSAGLAVLLTLVVAALACTTVQRWGYGPDLVTPPAGAAPLLLPTASPPGGGVPELASFRAAMRAEYKGDVDQFAQATRYSIAVTVTFPSQTTANLTGREFVHYTNRQSFALNDLYLMLWPNGGDQYLSQMTMTNVRVNGQALTPILENANLAARLPLTAPLAPGASVDISADFSVAARDGLATNGEARFGLTNGVLFAPTFYPLIPRIVDGHWQTISAPPGGDTTNSDTALYAWQVTAPADLAIVGSGTTVGTVKSPITQTQSIFTGPMRDLALAVGPLKVTRRQVGDITLNAWTLASHANLASRILDYTAAQVQNLQSEVGDYPFSELDVVEVPGGFAGIEYPGEVFIGVVGDSNFLERVVVHETGHQWFYSLIGDDQLLQPWLDEAAASYTEVLYEEKAHGAQAAQSALQEFKDELRYSHTKSPDIPIGLPVSGYASQNDYGVLVYAKGALFFDTLRHTLGDATFFAFLKAYYAKYRYGFVSSADFEAAAEQTCSCDLKKLFDLWVYQGGPVSP